MRVVLTLLVLLATWLLWSGMLYPRMLALGALSCVLVLYLAARMGFFDRHLYLLHLLERLPRYWAWLAKELVKANFAVARIVLHPRLPISPTVIELDSIAPGAAGQALLANSITLTPGTVTLDVDAGRLKVHCLTREGAAALLEGEMNRRVAGVAES